MTCEGIENTINDLVAGVICPGAGSTAAEPSEPSLDARSFLTASSPEIPQAISSAVRDGRVPNLHTP
jgi:hypothetical protein